MAQPIPMPRSLDTERLRLTVVTLDDTDEQLAAMQASLAEFRPWFPWAQSEPTTESVRQNVGQCVADFEFGRQLEWAIRTREGEYVGRIGVHRLDWSVPRGEIGYWVATPMTGRGYAQEATRALVDALFAAGFRRVELVADVRNEASANVARKTGFQLEGVFRSEGVDAQDASVLVDSLHFAQVR